MPHLTAQGRSLLVAAIALLVAGTWFSLPASVLIGLAALSVLAVAQVFAVIRLWAAEAAEISAELTLASGGTVRRDEAQDVVLTLENRSRLGLGSMRVQVAGPSCLEVQQEILHLHWLHRRTRASIPLKVTPRRTGAWRFWGVRVEAEDTFSLVRVSVWLPAVLPLEVLPGRALPAPDSPSASRQRQARDVLGTHLRQRSGQSTEIREIREYRPGDPWKAIAWSASARRGSLQVREFASEEARELICLLDLAPSMRAGPHGAVVEYALDSAAAFVEQHLDARDRVGLITFAETIHLVTAPGAGPRQRRLLTEHMMGVNAMVGPAFSELGEGEVRALVGRFLLLQERLDFRLRGEEHVFDESLLDRWLQATLDREDRSPAMKAALRREPPGLTPARRFAWRHGLELPTRAEGGRIPREQAWERAFEEAMRVSRRARDWLLVTDLAEVESLARLEELLLRIRARGRRVEFLVLDAPSFVVGGGAPDRPSIRSVLAWAEREEIRGVLRLLERLGVTVRVGVSGRLPEALHAGMPASRSWFRQSSAGPTQA